MGSKDLRGLEARFERLGRWAKEPTPEPTKTTAEQELAAMEAKASSRSASREEREGIGLGTVLRVVACVAMLLGAVAFMVMANTESGAHSQIVLDAKAAQVELRGELDGVQQQAKKVAIDPKKAEQAIIAAEGAAKQVADIQNEYHGVEMRTEVKDGVAVLVGQEDYKAVNAKMRSMFTDTAITEGYDASQQWFQMSDYDPQEGWTRSAADAYGWSAPQVWTVLDASHARVVWELRETKTGDLLAWAQGNYDAETKKFGQFVIGVTSQGQRRIAATDSSGAHQHDNTGWATAAPTPKAGG